MNDASKITLPHLRALIGLRVRYEGRPWVVVEVVESPPSLALAAEGAFVIQTDMHGRPWDYATETRMINVLTADETGLSDELLGLEIIED